MNDVTQSQSEAGLSPMANASTAKASMAKASMAKIADLVALTKPRITFMVLVTTLGGLFLAPSRPETATILFALLGTALVVGSANTLNCWIERDVDKHMSRTKNRPLPAGRLSASTALVWGLLLGAVAVPLLALSVNLLTAVLAAIALASYVCVYTPLKQVSTVALLVGAVPGAMPPLMGWTAATGELSVAGLVLFGILFLWQLPHFLAISMFREAEYTRAGIKVVPALRGAEATRWQAIAWALALVPVSLLLAPLGIAGALYTSVALAAGALFAWFCLKGFRAYGEDPRATHARWGRKVFVASLLYLPALFVGLALDVALF